MEVRVLMPDGNFSDMGFPAMPRIGDILVVPDTPRSDEYWIVRKAGFVFRDMTKDGLPIIEVEEAPREAVASGAFQRLSQGG